MTRETKINSTNENNPENSLIAAEYVLGALDASARADFMAKLEQDPALRAEVVYWEDQLAGFGLQSPPVTPPASVWRGIQMQTGVRNPGKRKRRGLRRWAKCTGIAASLAVMALVATLITLSSEHKPVQVVASGAAPSAQESGALGALPDSFQPQPSAIAWSTSAPKNSLATVKTPADHPDFVGNLQDYASNVGWKVAGYNARGALQVVATGTPYTRLWEPTTLELWLMPVNAYEQPIALGLLPVSGERILPIAKYVAPEFYTDYNKLAVSREPPGGSKTGEPSGEILFMTTLKLASDN